MNEKDECNMLNFVLGLRDFFEVTRREYNIGGNV